MLRSKLRGGALTDVILLAILVVLVYVFITRKGPAPADNQVMRTPNEDKAASKPDEAPALDSRIKTLPDLRPGSCKNAKPPPSTTVSIIVDFYDYQFYDVKTAVSAILHHTQHALISEIILINDASSLRYIASEAESFVDGVDMMSLMTNDQQLGSARSRMRAFKEAKSPVVVFIDHNVIVNQGWLEPLLEALDDKPRALVLPHFDRVHDPVSYELKTTADNLVSTLSWRMVTRMTESKFAKKDGKYYVSPVIRGNIFAVTKKYFEEIGGYLTSFSEFGGENLELSVRAWLCGDSVLVVPCSRVGILNLNDPVKIQSHQNVKVITEVWFSSFKDLIYRTSNIDPTLSDDDKKLISTARKHTEQKACRSIDWFVKEIVHDISSPSEKAKYFGLLRCKTGRCARVGSDGRVELGQCAPDKYGSHSSDMMFEYDSDRKVKVNGKCLSTLNTAYIVAEDCKEGDVHQMYDYTEKLSLKNLWSGYCWMHVTDPDKTTNGRRQIAMAQDCDTDNSNGEFIGFEFLPL